MDRTLRYLINIVNKYEILNSILSFTGSKLVSFLLSKPTANWICGTEHEPKFPMSAALLKNRGKAPVC